ncbi:VOC family protein [Dermacoccus sp. Ellin185]|uniref:VOC family protein n=1 Tax=Dermacoccus sp. Ellin185 TaxID=188626 RepID=UPI0001E63E22|nr:VOC family protein [Dermacoccus sp. Ellin185]EFP57040.1 hypothetical protein HMPREF0321_2972 [Dermacoccus sp. Ellin185]
MEMRLTQLVFECEDPEVVALFWQRVLDLEPPQGEPDWLTLQWQPVGRFSFHRVEGYQAPTWPGANGQQHVHFDLLVEDLQKASFAVMEAGGAPLTAVLNPGPKAWRIFADPAGHPFCLVTVPE